MKTLKSALAFLFLLNLLLVFPLSSAQSYNGQNKVAQLNSLRVLNRNTGKSYSTIQEAINAPETLAGHEIFVASGIYYEHVTVNKSLSLVGEDKSTTIIDGKWTEKVVYVTADNVEITNFTVQNGTFGLWLDKSKNSKIIGNTLQMGSNGIRLYHCKNVEVTQNNVYGYTKFGVELDSSGNSTLRSNKIAENKYNFGVDGTSILDFINDIDTSNTVNGKPIHYLINRHNVTIDSFTFQKLGYLALVNSTNIEVQNLNVQDNIQGVLFAFTENSTITNVNAKNNWNGIYVTHSRDISIKGNNANSNFDYGIKFFNSSSSLASENNVDNNGWAGIGLFRSPSSILVGNEANFNTYNLHVVLTNNSVITRNNAQNKLRGYSIAVYYSHNNIIYHNMFVDSLLYVETRNSTPFIPRNSWDNGLEGNYWSLYKGVDADEDGIGDTPFMVGQNNVDNHPLMGKFSDFTVTVRGTTYSITIISNSTISQFHFSPDDGKVSFMASGKTRTEGFSRIAVPNALLQDLQSSNLTFLINEEQPFLHRKWTDETKTYLYFSYANTAFESAISPWLIVGVALIILTVSVVVFTVSQKRHWVGSLLLRRRRRGFRVDS